MFEMWQLIIGVFLAIGTIWDLRTKKIPIIYLIVFSGVVVIYNIFYMQNSWWHTLMGMGIGMLFVMCSKVTQEKIGYGDSWIITNLGIHLGVWKLFLLLYFGFFSCALWCVIALKRKWVSRKSRIPLVPFLMLGYIGVLGIEVVF